MQYNTYEMTIPMCQIINGWPTSVVRHVTNIVLMTVARSRKTRRRVMGEFRRRTHFVQ